MGIELSGKHDRQFPSGDDFFLLAMMLLDDDEHGQEDELDEEDEDIDEEDDAEWDDLSMKMVRRDYENWDYR